MFVFVGQRSASLQTAMTLVQNANRPIYKSLEKIGNNAIEVEVTAGGTTISESIAQYQSLPSAA